MRIHHWIVQILVSISLTIGGLFRRNAGTVQEDLAITFNDVGDGLTDIDLRTGVLVLGAPGSGKTAFVGRVFRRTYLRRGYGGMVLCVKQGEAAAWIADAKACGREMDIIHVTKGGLPFDPLAHEERRPGDGAGDTTNQVEMISTLCNVGRPHVTSNGDDSAQFFKHSTEQAERAAINLLKAGGEAVSLINIRNVINSLPDMAIPEDAELHTLEMKLWIHHSYTGALLKQIRFRFGQGLLKEEDWRAAEYASDFLCSEWPSLAPQTRTSIKQTFSSTCDKLIAPPFDKMMCSGTCAYVPEQTFIQGKIIILDLPSVEFGKSAELLQIANKLAFQKAVMRRDINRYPRPVFLYADEFQVFCIPQDTEFQEICREVRGCVWYATQNLQNLAKRLQEHHPGASTLSLIGNIGNRIFLQNGETEFTNKWSAASFGQVYENVVSGGHGGVGWRQEERYLVHPQEFIRLRTPSPQFPCTAGFIYRNGQAWKATGESFLPHVFTLD